MIGDLVRLKSHPLALGRVLGFTAGGRVTVNWATTTKGVRMIRMVPLNESPEDLDIVPAHGMIDA